MITCKYCIAKYGFSLKNKDRIFDTDSELADHIEEWHGIPVRRDNETEVECLDRCAKKGIIEDREKCQCKDCEALRESNRIGE